MKLVPIKKLTDISEGDTLVIKGNHAEGAPLQTHTVIQVKVTDSDGTEIILRKKDNVYFNLGMYLNGKSWVQEVQKLVDSPEPVTMKVNFDGFRQGAVRAYNNLAETLNEKTNHSKIVFYSIDIQEYMDDLRDSLVALICLERAGEFESLPLTLEVFNPEGELID